MTNLQMVHTILAVVALAVMMASLLQLKQKLMQMGRSCKWRP